MVSDVGTWQWAERTGGRLSRRDRAEMIRQAVLARLLQLPDRLRDSLRGEVSSFDIPDPPDSVLAVQAEEAVRTLSPPWLHGHCLLLRRCCEIAALLLSSPSGSPGRSRCT